MSNGLRSKNRLRRLLDEDYDMNEKISNNDKEILTLFGEHLSLFLDHQSCQIDLVVTQETSEKYVLHFQLLIILLYYRKLQKYLLQN